jgi:ribosomal protein L17
MNRVKDIYETAVKFLSLQDMARAIIGTHFRIINFNEFFIDQDKANSIILEHIGTTKVKYDEFKRIVNHSIETSKQDDPDSTYYC